jgi:hypothetical protein
MADLKLFDIEFGHVRVMFEHERPEICLQSEDFGEMISFIISRV